MYKNALENSDSLTFEQVTDYIVAVDEVYNKYMPVYINSVYVNTNNLIDELECLAAGKYLDFDKEVDRMAIDKMDLYMQLSLKNRIQEKFAIKVFEDHANLKDILPGGAAERIIFDNNRSIIQQGLLAWVQGDNNMASEYFIKLREIIKEYTKGGSIFNSCPEILDGKITELEEKK